MNATVICNRLQARPNATWQPFTRSLACLKTPPRKRSNGHTGRPRWSGIRTATLDRKKSHARPSRTSRTRTRSSPTTTSARSTTPSTRRRCANMRRSKGVGAKWRRRRRARPRPRPRRSTHRWSAWPCVTPTKAITATCCSACCSDAIATPTWRNASPIACGPCSSRGARRRPMKAPLCL